METQNEKTVAYVLRRGLHLACFPNDTLRACVQGPDAELARRAASELVGREYRSKHPEPRSKTREEERPRRRPRNHKRGRGWGRYRNRT